MRETIVRGYRVPLFLAIVLFFAANIAVARPAIAANPVRATKSPAVQQAQPPEKWATVYGVKLRYLEAGSGPALILLHGLGGDASNWASTIGPLSQKFRVVVPDQIGFGKSEKPLINYRVGTYVDFLKAFMKELKIERASLVGNSLGGWIAAAFTLSNPQMVDHLVLVDSAGYSLPKDSDPAVLAVLNPSTRDQIKQLLPLIFYNTAMFAGDTAIDAFLARKINAGDSYTTQRIIDSIVRGEDVVDGKLSGLKKPTLIVWGREDKLTPLSLGERFKQDIAGSELLVLEKCGHVPQLEKAQEFNTALIKFLGAGM